MRVRIPVALSHKPLDKCPGERHETTYPSTSWCIDFLTPSTPLIIPHRLPAFLESLMPLKN